MYNISVEPSKKVLLIPYDDDDDGDVKDIYVAGKDGMLRPIRI